MSGLLSGPIISEESPLSFSAKCPSTDGFSRDTELRLAIDLVYLL